MLHSQDFVHKPNLLQKLLKINHSQNHLPVVALEHNEFPYRLVQSNQKLFPLTLESQEMRDIDINLTRRTIYVTITYPVIVINVDYLNKWCSHNIKLPN